MSTRTFYDAIDVNNLPAGGDGYLGYDDGNWPDAAAIAAKFPSKLVIKITTNPAHNEGVIGDGPPDNGTWQQWVGWVEMRRAAGEDPWINTNFSNWSAGKLAFSLAKVAEPNWWIAKYDNDPTIPAGALMKQYASNDKYDTSSAAPYLPGIDPKPASTATPAAPTVDDEEDSMQAQGGFVTLSWSQGSKHIVQVAFDTVGNNQPDLRVVLLLDTGPLVLSNSWKPDHTDAGKVLRFPDANIPHAYGIELQPVGAGQRYAASVS
jgi:hypothetical protein